MGNAVTAANRQIPGGIEYLFEAESSDPDGNVSRSKVYVTVCEGADSVFTQVVR